MKTIGLISANYHGSKFGALTEDRTLASLPYGGRYRLIDFALSNMVNSGISTVGIIAPYNSGSLIDHIGVGNPWSLGHKTGGLFLMPGSTYGVAAHGSRFLLRDLIENRKFFERDDADYVILTSSSDVWNIDFEPLIKQHSESSCPVTVVYKKMPRGEDYTGLFFDIDGDGKVKDIKTTGSGWSNYSTDCFIADREFIIEFLDWFYELDYEDMFHILRDNLDKIDVDSYEFKGYFGSIRSSADFLKVNQGMCDYDIRNEVFCNPERLIYTKTQDESPAFFLPGSDVRNSVVSAGCGIEGRVENSIIFRSVHIAKGAVVKNSIIMMHGEIGEGAVLDNVIADKYVTVTEGVKIYGGGGDPIIIGKEKTL